jgi:serine/threonine-protein kinase
MSTADSTDRDAERLRLVRALFDEADALPANERSRWLDARTAHDPTLRRDVQELLALATDDDALGTPWQISPPQGMARLESDDELIGRSVGPYRITRLIGRGGMGAVFEAERNDAQFRMRVALKLLRRDAGSALAVQRFRYERQILASLRHPNIAALLDGGLTDDGQPYIVMEYVDGVPITQHVQRAALDTRARVRLMLGVCAAVAHAHGRLVVHRDLKPGNILVSTDGIVRLLDFGIARLLREADDLDALPPTEANLRALTPDYASPEQFLGEPPQLTTDVYALGVVLYELLTDARPYTLRGKPWAEQLELVTQRSVAPPSRAVLAQAAPDALRARALRGDLDAIVLKALEKSPRDRYATVQQLASDLTAWLDGKRVAARLPSRAERVWRVLRRRPFETAAASIALLALLGAAWWSTLAARDARREQQRTAAVNTFLQDMLASADPDIGGRTLTVRSTLDAAARRLRTSAVAPDIAGDVHLTLANAYYALGEWATADSQALDALALRQRTLGAAHPRTAEVLALRGNIAEALGEVPRGVTLLDSAVRMLRQHTPRDERRLADAMGNLARLLDGNGDLARAEQLAQEELALRRSSRDSATRAGVPLALSNLAIWRVYQGKLVEAESLQRVALSDSSLRGATQRPRYAEFERGLASILEERGQYAAADSLMRHALPILEASLGPEHTTYLRARANAVRLRVRSGDYHGALEVAQPVVQAIGTVLPATDPTSASVLQFVAAAHDSLGQYAEGESALRRAWELRRQGMPAGHWAVASAEATVGAHLLLVRRYAEAERLLRRGYEGVVATHGASAPYSVAIARRLVMLFEATGREREAAQWKARSGAR